MSLRYRSGGKNSPTTPPRFPLPAGMDGLPLDDVKPGRAIDCRSLEDIIRAPAPFAPDLDRVAATGEAVLQKPERSTMQRAVPTAYNFAFEARRRFHGDVGIDEDAERAGTPR